MRLRGLLLVLPGLAFYACAGETESQSEAELRERCAALTDYRFEGGSADGHADPFGARAAGQARAGKIREPAQIIYGPEQRHKPRIGDFILANDKISLYIEGANRKNGYAPFGGEILAIEPVGENGRPTGASSYNETLTAFSRQTVKPDHVTVLNDGADGRAAVIRVSGILTNIPFLDPFAAFVPPEYGFPAALDYVLEPGAEKVMVRVSIANTKPELVDFAGFQRLGFFQASRNQAFSPTQGFAAPQGANPWAAFEGSASSFLFRLKSGGNMTAEFETTGLGLWALDGFQTDACTTKTVESFEILTATGGIDNLLETNRRVHGETAWREVTGTVVEAGSNAPMPDTLVHARSGNGLYLTRVKTDAGGNFKLHVPNEPVTLTPTKKGWEIPAATNVDGATAQLTLAQHATIQIRATDALTSEPLPVRVQIIPTKPPTAAPAEFGLREELNGRLWQEFAVTGNATLAVPPGEHRVVVTRGYEYELLDTVVNATASTPAVVNAPLLRSVSSPGVMCADFHVHSSWSVDSSDPFEEKVKGAVADGLEIPVASEHEWIVDFNPTIQRLGLGKWAFGVPSEELTTFAWGHFGVVPQYPKEDRENNGAIDWVGKKPPAFFREVNALPEKPVLIVNHPSSGALQGYFAEAEFNRQTATGREDLWSNEFAALEVFNDSDFDENRARSVQDWFALLNTDRAYWAVGNSDSHDQRTTFVGYPRNCLYFGHDDPRRLSPEIIRDTLKSGDSTVSGGLLMYVQGPGGVRSGGTSTEGDYVVTILAPSWINASKVEAFVDGYKLPEVPIVAASTGGPGKRWDVTINVRAQDSRPRHWVVFHAKGDGDLAPLHPGKKPFAVSNPIYFE